MPEQEQEVVHRNGSPSRNKRCCTGRTQLLVVEVASTICARGRGGDAIRSIGVEMEMRRWGYSISEQLFRQQAATQDAFESRGFR